MYNVLLDRSPTRYENYIIETDFRIGIQLIDLYEDIDIDDQDRILSCYSLLYGGAVPLDDESALRGLLWFLSCGKRYAPRDIEYIERMQRIANKRRLIQAAKQSGSPLLFDLADSCEFDSLEELRELAQFEVEQENEPEATADRVIEEFEDIVESDRKIAYDFTIDSDLIYAAFQQQYGIDLSTVKMHWFKFAALFQGLKDTQLNELMYYRTVDTSKLPKSSKEEAKKLQNKHRIRKVTAARKRDLMQVFGAEWRDHI